MKNKQNKMTERLQKLVKKRKTPKVVIKAGTVRFTQRRSSSSPDSDYYPPGFYNN
jgi:hypothetical protein